ncbi:YdcF family protein [Nocardiopsis ansamitocini]|nr:YdcF family protein [Nocardiopsis ansamitocini]
MTGDGREGEGRQAPGAAASHDEVTQVFTRADNDADESEAADPGPGSGSDTFSRSPDRAHAQTFTRPAGFGRAADVQEPRALTEPFGHNDRATRTMDRPVRDDPRPGRERSEGVTQTMRRASVAEPLDDFFDDDDDDDDAGASTRRRTPARRRRRRSPAALVLVLLMLTAVMVPVGTWGWVWYTARQDDRPVSDAIVVLGASQYNGTPSPVFEARLSHAAELYGDGVAPAIVTVGGKQPGDNFTEGESGRNWLMEAGIPGDQIVAIGDGSDTLQSLELVSDVFRERGWGTAVIVSDPWHSLRSRKMAEDFGIESATSPARSGPAVRERDTQLRYITRETVSLWHYWIFGESATVRVDAV